MKKILTSLMLLAMCTPAMALTFSLDGADGVLTINYNLAAGEGLRGLALTVTNVSGDGQANGTYTCAPFNTFIDFAADVDNTYTAVGQGNPFAMITPDVVAGQYVQATPAASFALSMGYLDEAAGQAAITTSGSITVDFTLTANTVVTVALDTLRGGAVGDALVVDAAGLGNVTILADVVPTDAVNINAPFRAAWDQFNKPACWAFQRNCRGEVNNEKVGLFWVQNNDLAVLASAFNKGDAKLTGNMICADFDHKKVGLFRVQNDDLTILAANFNKGEAKVPVCPMDWDGDGDNDYNFWAN